MNAGRSGHRLLTPLFASVVATASAVAFAPGCYNAGDGTAPPGNRLYFPVGLVVSSGGSVLYVANSDFDLQWNGGTLQSYDLVQVRADAARVIEDPSVPLGTVTPDRPNGKYTRPPPPPGTCPGNPPTGYTDGTPTRQALGETCSPPVDATLYVKDAATIGAFATDMRLSCSQARLLPSQSPKCTSTRLYVPVRGDASLTWGDVVADRADQAPVASDTPDTYPPFKIDCGVRRNNRCDAAHHAGNDPNEANNTRHVTMPGEPFGMTESEDGASILVTHQTDTKVSLLATGFDPTGAFAPSAPSLQFVLDGFPSGGNGIATIPHDPDAFPGGVGAPNPAFLLTTRSAAEIDLIRYYTDQGTGPIAPGADAGAGGGQPSTLHRPFITRESLFSLTANAGSTDSRGIVIDPTPRIRCKLALPAGATDAQKAACARRPARVFVANRSPATLLVGEIGEPATDGSSNYDADRLVIYRNIPLTFGPSRVYLAPIVDATGALALRVFIVCFDSSTIFVFDPEAGVVENIIRVGQGPYAMAFDPFDLEAVARGDKVADDLRVNPPAAPGDPKFDPNLTVKRYRFAYVASFTKSFVQLVDLDNSRAKKDTFERVVFTLGQPTNPKGT